MESKYYVPELEELRIGYLCEINTFSGYKTGTFPEVLYLNKELDEFGKDDFMRAAHAILRTKYLDKEDIELLGWLHVGGQMISLGTQDFELRNGDVVYLLKYIPRAVIKNEVRRETAIMLQMTVDNPDQIPGGNEAAMKYYGACPSINELKFLMKLLDIK